MNNKLGIYYAYWQKNWEADIIPLIARASRLEFDILEINAALLQDQTKESLQKIRDTARQQKIELTYCLGIPPELDLASPDKNVRNEGIEYLKAIIKKIRLTGGSKLSGLIHAAWNTDFSALDITREQYQRFSQQSLKEVLPATETHEVRLNIEVVNRFEQFLLNTAVEAVEFVEAIDHPNLKIHLDTYHMNIEEDSIYNAVVTAGSNLGHLHVGENNRRPPGEGEVFSWEELFQALKDIDYQDDIVLEPFVISGGNIAAAVALWRDLGRTDAASLDQRANKARKFLTDKLTR